MDLANSAPAVLDGSSLAISAKTGAGLDALRSSTGNVGFETTTDDSFIARERHLTALRAADEHLQMAYAHALTQDQKLDLFAEELRLAVRAAQRHHRRNYRRRPARRDFLQFLYW